jgi:hypothetical protein
MKKIIVYLLLFSFLSVFSQTNNDIAKVYIKRAYEAIEESIDYETALKQFEKAMKYTDTIVDKNVAMLGSLIYLEQYHKRPSEEEELRYLEMAKKYSVQYFNLADSNTSEEYIVNVENSILINENIETLNNQILKLAQERLKEEQTDSLKILWSKKAEILALSLDSIYSFNSNNYAVFSKNGKFGILNDSGVIVMPANEFVDAVNYAGFILLKNKHKEASKLYYFNTNTGMGSLLPNPSDFNPLSTNYGKIMLPRANGRLVVYPNNSIEPMVFDLNQAKVVRVVNVEEVLENLKKKDIIKKYNKDNDIKIDKEWYTFGGHLGGGIHPLYLEGNYEVHAYLFSVDGTVLFSSSDYDFIGTFYDNRAQALKGNTVSWINQNGTKISDAKDKMETYAGNSKVVKLEDGVYQIYRDGLLIKGEESLEKLPGYLRKFQ